MADFTSTEKITPILKTYTFSVKCSDQDVGLFFLTS